MRILLQRVSRASVRVVLEDGSRELTGTIANGLLALVGIRESDTLEEVRWMVEKVAQIRIFEDNLGKMNLSVEDIGGSVLAVSQFTLYGDLPKGNRPSFIRAAEPGKAEHLYNQFVSQLRTRLGEARVAEGRFRAKMVVELTNDGPVTIMLERESTAKSG